jgi:hypothetical protein
MKNAVKFLPIVVGLALGWLLTNPPAWLSFLGGWAYVAGALMVFVLFVGFIAFQITASLPEDVSLEPLTDHASPPEVRGLLSEFAALGFRQAGPPLRVGISPPGLLVPLVHEEARAYATVFRTGTVPAKTAFDVVSILEGERGGLTTGAEAMGTALPAFPGSLRQVFAGARPEKVFQGHVQGLSHLKSRGLTPRAVSASSFATDFKEGMRRQRRAFLASPIPNTLVTMWRASSGRTPHMGPIASQEVAQRAIRELTMGRRS